MADKFSRISLILPEIKEFLSQGKKDELRFLFQEYEPIEIAEMLKNFNLKEEVYLFSLCNIDLAADIFEKMDKEEQLALIGAIDEKQKRGILDELAPDERVDFFEELPEEMVVRFLNIMEKEEARETRELMGYDKNSAGGRMTTDFAHVKENITAGGALNNLRKTAKDLEMVYYIYVLNKKNKLVGVVSLKDLVLAEPKKRINEIMDTRLITIPIDMDQEQVAREIARYDLVALPVVDNGEMKGIITVDDIIDVIKEENTEDMYKISAAGKHIENYTSMKPSFIAKHRALYLLIFVIMDFFSASILKNYSFIVRSAIALSFFVPLIMDTGGNTGTQAATVMVRSLATGEVRLKDIWRVIKKEFIIGIMVGVILGIVALLRAVLLQGNPFVSLTVSLTMIITVIIATCLGSTLPLLLKRIGVDPALISGPLITSIVDIISLIIYFEIALHFLGS
ncbi:MAG: magnesium transporter [Candidatus Aerophobetes bacterium]|nr:magnesium transporter [Candidatus Aerophobetes bacterium]